MGNPTPGDPFVENEDGTISVLILQDRQFVLPMIYHGLMDTTGYVGKVGFAADFGAELVALADSESGGDDIVTFEPYEEDAVQVGTLITAYLSTATCAGLEIAKGKFDGYIRPPGLEKEPIIIGDWKLRRAVTTS